MSKKFLLPAWQKQILNAVAKSDIGKIAVWGGGTALADVYLDHRMSYDLDFFIDNPLTGGESDLILGIIKSQSLININYKRDKTAGYTL